MKLFLNVAGAATLLASYGYWQMRETEQAIAGFRTIVAEIGAEAKDASFDADGVRLLPTPVQRYLSYSIKGPLSGYKVVRVAQKGDFRRPMMEAFEPTVASQVIAANVPAMVFSATTPIIAPIWARAYDFYAHGKMEMRAKILDVLTVVDEQETPELDRISLRRWLLESALYPQALLPGGHVRWEAIDDDSARAIVSSGGMEASMVAYFDAEGRMTFMQAEEDGDLTTSYHGSGEHVARSDYRQVGNLMIPHSFTISRAADGQIYPFWMGKMEEIIYKIQSLSMFKISKSY
ncbi:DUF6920 family protein [uncultured Cohaesibacter sp.]|uniref:DUF6920 family protein n=1 Tax=uncultured Cohaesibacter sp. TaxID=1002546 RepID=UPI0029C71893|nr:DUF6544 family protein [uncultured Cohaesibacter sp.]